MGSTVFIVSEIGWEYDDNYYNRTDNDDGTPIKAYRRKERAEEAAKQVNVEKLRDIFISDNFGSYVGEGGWDNAVGYGNNGVQLEALFKLFDEYDVTIKDKRYVDYELPEGVELPWEFFEKLSEIVALQFYTVSEVPEAEEEAA